MIGPGASRGPSPGLPIAYLAAAALWFVLAAVAVPVLATELAGHYYHPRILALTHTVTLGWITLTIMGASYQLVPIVLERPVWSERLARWQLGLIVAGIVGMVGHFFIAAWSGLLWAAGLVVLAIAAHVVNLGLSLRGLRRWTFTALLVAGALVGFGLTGVAGVALAVDRVWPFLPDARFPILHAHFHLALLGWVLPMVIGVAARVYPMFLLAREPEGWPGRVQLGGLAAGVPLVVVGIMAAPPALAAGALAVAGVVVAHRVWVAAMARDRKRPRLDWSLRFVLTGAAFLVPAAVLGLAFALGLAAGHRLGLAYATLALGGWASLTIVGMMLKIVPFLVWYRVYGPLVGRAPIPTLAQLSWPAAEATAYALLTVGLAGFAAALATGEAGWIRLAGVLLGAGGLAFLAALARVLHHLAPCARRATRSAGVTAVRQA